MNGAAEAVNPEYADAALRAEIDVVLASLAAELAAPDPVTDAIRYALAAGGKRLRPILCLAAMDAAGPARSIAAAPAAEPRERTARLRAACALELVHTYSLLHDDLPCMDDDDLRRGQPTAHRVYGSEAAVLAGFALIPMACRLLFESAIAMGATDARARRCVRELCAGAGAAGMVGGQVLDLQSEGSALEAAELRRVHEMKTGALFRSALRIGAILAGAAEAVIDALGTYGAHLGMAFQIQDDVLDVTMDSDALGKTPGKDRDADKTTFASQLGVRDARRAAAGEVEAALGALAGAGLESALLERLARFAADRDR